MKTSERVSCLSFRLHLNYIFLVQKGRETGKKPSSVRTFHAAVRRRFESDVLRRSGASLPTRALMARAM